MANPFKNPLSNFVNGPIFSFWRYYLGLNMYESNSTKEENRKAEKRLAAVDEHPVRLLADYEYTIPAL